MVIDYSICLFADTLTGVILKYYCLNCVDGP